MFHILRVCEVIYVLFHISNMAERFEWQGSKNLQYFKGNHGTSTELIISG